MTAVSGREQLMEITRREIENAMSGNLDLAPNVLEVPTERYIDPEQWELEVERIFKRLPLALAFTDELREIGSYKSIEVAGVPVLITRTMENEVKAFVNMCSHRGAIVVDEGCGEARDFSCPYHAWLYDLEGNLQSVFDDSNFGEFDKTEFGLTPLPVAERAGLIWVTLNPKSNVDIDTFLSGYADVLEHLGFEDHVVAGKQPLDGPNWKVAYDGYRDFYHVPILHRNSFGPDGPYQADYYAWGPHVRVVSPKGHERLSDIPEDQWNVDDITGGVWTIFPNISIAGTPSTGYMVSMMFPGKSVTESYTIQNFTRPEPVPEGEEKELEDHMKFMGYVVGEEDYYTGKRVQRSLATGAKKVSMFGRNENGGQLFHRWVQALVDTPDEKLNELLEKGIDN